MEMLGILERNKSSKKEFQWGVLEKWTILKKINWGRSGKDFKGVGHKFEWKYMYVWVVKFFYSKLQ